MADAAAKKPSRALVKLFSYERQLRERNSKPFLWFFTTREAGRLQVYSRTLKTLILGLFRPKTWLGSIQTNQQAGTLTGFNPMRIKLRQMTSFPVATAVALSIGSCYLLGLITLAWDKFSDTLNTQATPWTVVIIILEISVVGAILNSVLQINRSYLDLKNKDLQKELGALPKEDPRDETLKLIVDSNRDLAKQVNRLTRIRILGLNDRQNLVLYIKGTLIYLRDFLYWLRLILYKSFIVILKKLMFFSLKAAVGAVFGKILGHRYSFDPEDIIKHQLPDSTPNWVAPLITYFILATIISFAYSVITTLFFPQYARTKSTSFAFF